MMMGVGEKKYDEGVLAFICYLHRALSTSRSTADGCTDDAGVMA